MAKTTEVATSATNGAVDIAPDRAQAIAVAQAAMAEMKSTEFDTEQMLVDIMQAQSMDDILGSEVVHLKDIIGVPFTVLSAELQESKFEDSFIPAYAVMRVKFDDGNTAIVTTGASQVVATLVKMHANKWFPYRVGTAMLTTSKGNDVVKFVKPPPEQF